MKGRKRKLDELPGAPIPSPPAATGEEEQAAKDMRELRVNLHEVDKLMRPLMGALTKVSKSIVAVRSGGEEEPLRHCPQFLEALAVLRAALQVAELMVTREHIAILGIVLGHSMFKNAETFNKMGRDLRSQARGSIHQYIKLMTGLKSPAWVGGESTGAPMYYFVRAVQYSYVYVYYRKYAAEIILKYGKKKPWHQQKMNKAEKDMRDRNDNYDIVLALTPDVYREVDNRTLEQADYPLQKILRQDLTHDGELGARPPEGTTNQTRPSKVRDNKALGKSPREAREGLLPSPPGFADARYHGPCVSLLSPA